MKQLRGTLILLFLALLGGAYIFWNERDPVPERDALVMLRARPAQVREVALHDGERAVRLRRDGELWRVSETGAGVGDAPVSDLPADPEAVETLLSDLELVQSSRAIEAGEDLTAYGLSAPTRRIEVDGATLWLGNAPEWAPGQIYARTQTGVGLISDVWSRTLEKSGEAWSDTRALRFVATDVNALDVRLPAVTASFVKREADWFLTQPVAARADDAALEGALSALGSMRIERWLDATGSNPEAWGLSEPASSIAVGDARLDIGRREGEGFAARNSRHPGVFLLSSASVGALDKPLIEWRDRTIAQIPLEEARRVEITWNGATRAFERRGEGWVTEGAAQTQAEDSRVLDVLFLARSLRAREWIDAPAAGAHGLESPLLRLRFSRGSSLDLRIGQAQDAFWAATSNAPVARLEDGAIESIRPQLDALVAPAATSPDPTPNASPANASP